MSQPRRRRRRRKKGGQAAPRTDAQGGQSKTVREQTPQASGAARRSRRRRRRGTGGTRENAMVSPSSSEDIVAGRSKPAASDLADAPDDTTLEQVIGDLQSEWGVPNSPQEYRITIKVADKERTRAPVDPNQNGGNGRAPATHAEPAQGGDRPKREKAPAAPRIISGADEAEDGTPKRRKRGRRRRRRKGGSGAS